jgi:gliding motility-associated-like protein
MWAIDNIRVKRKDTVRHLQLSNLTPGYHNTTLYCKYQTYGTDTLTCIDSIRKSNYLFVSNPIASFSAIPPSGCSPLPVSFTSLSSFTPGAGFVKLKWDYGDGGKDSGLINPVSHTYTKAGVYNVMLTALDSNGCTSSIVQPNLINTRKIVAGFGVNKTTACAGEVLQFYGNLSFGGYPLKYYWHFGDGDTSTLETPTHAYAAVGSYTVQLIATDSATGCADTLTRIAYINIARPHASFTLSDTFSICPPLIVNFNSTSTGASTYAWSFGDGNSSPLANPTNTYGAPGLFYVTLIVKNAAGCADTSSATLVRVLGYAGALTYKPLIGCAPLTVNFRALVTNAPSLLWDYSDGVTMPAHGDTISHVYLTPGKYVPKLIFSNNAGCISSSVGLDTIKVDEVTGGFTMSPPCERSFITFTDTSSGALVKPTLSVWTFDSANVKTGNPVNWRYPAPGEYDVTLVTANWNNCRDTITKHFTVQPLPVVKASDDTSICVPDNAMLSVTGALTYVWTPGISLNCANCSNPVAAPTISTGYVVFGTDSNGCVNSDTVVVNIQSKTTFSTMDSGEVCLGQAFQLHASGAVSFHWTPDSTIDHPDIADPLARPKKTTTYFVIAKEGSCAADTQKVRVRVNPLPFVDAGKDETAIAGNPVQLQASGNNIHHLVWSPDSLLDCTTCYGPIAHPMMTTTFYVTAYTEKGCPATDSVTIHVLCDGSQLFVPNTFTPNGDGKNDYFFPRGVGINEVELLRVYDRWGELLFERQHFGLNEEYAGWDGTAKGKLLPPDVYVYMLVAPCGASERITLKGDITLMR